MNRVEGWLPDESRGAVGCGGHRAPGPRVSVAHSLGAAPEGGLMSTKIAPQAARVILITWSPEHNGWAVTVHRWASSDYHGKLTGDQVARVVLRECEQVEAPGGTHDAVLR